MKHVKKSLLILTCLIFILSLNGCKKNKQQTTNTRKAEVLTPKAPGDEVLDYGEAVVDISNVSQGYVAVSYTHLDHSSYDVKILYSKRTERDDRRFEKWDYRCCDRNTSPAFKRHAV